MSKVLTDNVNKAAAEVKEAMQVKEKPIFKVNGKESEQAPLKLVVSNT